MSRAASCTRPRGARLSLGLVLNAKESCEDVVNMGRIVLVATKVTKARQNDLTNSIQSFELVIPTLL